MKMTIFGLGISGLYALRYLAKRGHILSVIDKRPINEWDSEVFDFVSFENAYSEDSVTKFPESDLIILSPGIAREHPLLKDISPSKIISEGELVYKESDIPIIAITGTNGKTTTTTLMGLAFEKANYTPFVGGNIGLPVVEALMAGKKFDVLILELSSFQLESSPSLKAKVGVILNVTDNHGERYTSFSDYKKAKLNIFNNSTEKDLAIISSELAEEVSTQNKTLLKKDLIKKTMERFDFSTSRLVGDHNKENLFVVLETLKAFKVKNADSIIQELINEFKGVHYRLEYLGESKKHIFYNDAKSTNTFATVTALKATNELGHKISLIIGGKLRNDKVSLLEDLKPYKTVVSRIYVIGEASHLLEKELQSDFKIIKSETLKNVFENLNEDEKEILLFSPAFPSFDQYANYIKRGEDFEKLVQAYLKSCE